MAMVIVSMVTVRDRAVSPLVARSWCHMQAMLSSLSEKWTATDRVGSQGGRTGQGDWCGGLHVHCGAISMQASRVMLDHMFERAHGSVPLS